MRKKIICYLMTAAFLPMLLAGSAIVPGQAAAADKFIRLAYVEWSSEIASANLVMAVLREKLGYECEIMAMTADEMWKAVAEGRADAMVAAWLPGTHGHYYEQVKDRVTDLGPNLEGTRIGLVVPEITVGRQTAASGQRNRPYITVNSIPELRDYAGKFKGKIIGIDPEAGIMKKTREAMKAYGLTNYRLVQGSEVSMTAELSNAVRKQKWIVVTGWLPHWMFARWKLKFLEDPKGIYGGTEEIHTIVRKGLEEDMPEAYAFLDSFYWTPEDMGQLMIWIQDDDGLFPYEKAQRYMRYNAEQIQSWLD